VTQKFTPDPAEGGWNQASTLYGAV